MTTEELREYVGQAHCDATAGRHARFSELSRKLAVRLAKDLGLREGAYALRDDAPGQGVVMEADNLRVWFRRTGIIFQGRCGRDDGCPNWVPLRSALLNYERIVGMCRDSMRLLPTFRSL